MSDPLAGVHLRVGRSQYETASNLLHEWDLAEGVLQDAVHCPACKSSRVEFPQFTRKFVSTGFYAVLCALRIFERRFYCDDCHFTWPVNQKAEVPTDLLGWPVKSKTSKRPPDPPRQ
jgi:transposase-like protein